ncbi:MAG: bifunctional 2-polyprenyl-6-hydroxyphenol methylase/3-demethylubiquinol 3-O-methyltransferase UbiG [Gammaproteobacteria bacterium]|nr:bifunctional 2-polyprenyl-6-hydroxyphenol methylase/3-demethylubiquinol 3-O-methyltransferase UbiG [Gammaproteobacteria bacterium]
MNTASFQPQSEPDVHAGADIDPEEVEKFDRLAQHWWDEHGPLKTLHAVNPTRFTFINRHLSVNKQRLLDVGCGGGLLCELAAKNSAQVTGIDASADAIDAAKIHAADTFSIDYVVTNAAAFLATKPTPFDVVTCFELLEHVPDPEQLIADCVALTKPGGWLFFSTINRTPLAFAGAIVAAEYALRLLPRGTHRYDRFIRPAELATWCRHAGADVVDISGMRYDPFRSSASLTKRVDINYLLAARRKK